MLKSTKNQIKKILKEGNIKKIQSLDMELSDWLDERFHLSNKDKLRIKEYKKQIFIFEELYLGYNMDEIKETLSKIKKIYF